jgi:hypothetical protein
MFRVRCDECHGTGGDKYEPHPCHCCTGYGRGDCPVCHGRGWLRRHVVAIEYSAKDIHPDDLAEAVAEAEASGFVAHDSSDPTSWDGLLQAGPSKEDFHYETSVAPKFEAMKTELRVTGANTEAA